MPKLAIVTGAGTGIGRALAQKLVSKDFTVLAMGRREELLQSLQAEHPEAVEPVAADVATEEGHQRLLDALQGRSVDLLVHNAAVLTPNGMLEQVPREEFRKHLEINLEGPLYLTLALLPHFSPNARVLQVSSGAAHRAISGWGAYCVSKAAFHQLYQVLKEELAPRGVQVGSVRPGVVDTPMQAHIRSLSAEAFPNVAMFREMKESGQLTSPEEAGQFLCWLLLETEPDFFVEREYDIREPELRELWLR